MTPKQLKAKELVDKYQNLLFINVTEYQPDYQHESKQCALIAVENEYKSLKQQLFILRAKGLLSFETEKDFLPHLQDLIEEEKQMK